MKILIAVSTLSGGGTERVASILANAWASAGHDVLVAQIYSGGPETFYEVSPSVRQIGLARHRPLTGWHGLIARLLAFRSIVGRERPDVVVSFLTPVNVFVMLATAFRSVPRLLAERADPLSVPTTRAIRFFCKYFYPRAELIVVQTEEQKERVSLAFGPLARSITIPNPLPLDIPEPGQYSLQRSTNILISLGRLDSQKRVDITIDAFARIAQRFPTWELHIYGDGPCRHELETQAQLTAVSGRIIFKGRTRLAYSVLAAADVFVMSSDFEGFPNALIEAMAVGLPVVTSDCPCGSKEITQNGVYGVLFPTNDVAACARALDALMSNASMRSELGVRAAISVRERFDLSGVLAAWDSAFVIARAATKQQS